MTRNILIIDDDTDWVRMLGIRLRHEGYHVDAAFDAVQAITQAIELKPDLILLDIIMPAGDGVGVLEKLRASAKTINIPAIAITAVKSKGTKEAAEKLDLAGYFVKPIDTDKLIEKIKEVLVEK
ncbi:MAG: response regulator [Phycisphaerae bacterium]|nr:response regulator [Phycisphaerae bacterium]